MTSKTLSSALWQWHLCQPIIIFSPWLWEQTRAKSGLDVG